MNLLKVHKAAYLNGTPCRWLDAIEVHSLAEVETWFRPVSSHMLRLKNPDAPAGCLVTTSAELAQVMRTPHHNVLRALKSFEKHHGAVRTSHSPKGNSVTGLRRVPGLRAIRTKNDAMRGVLLWLPTLQLFIKWLLHSLRGHDGVVVRRSSEFTKAYGFLSGLVRRGNDASSSLLPALIDAWPEEVRLDEPTLEVVQTREITTAFKAPLCDERTPVKQLAKLLGCTEGHLRRQMRNTRNEYPQPEEDFLKVDESGKVSRKTAVFALLSMPKALCARMMLFNELFNLVTFNELISQAGKSSIPMLTSGPGAGIDFNDPAKAQHAFLHQARLHELAAADHAKEVASLNEDRGKLEAENRTMCASLQGKDTEILSLRAGLANMTSAGSLLTGELADKMVYQAAVLRKDHGLCGVLDMIKRIMHELTVGKLIELFGDVGMTHREAVRLTLRHAVGLKLLSADGAPVLRDSIVQQDIARRYRVYIPDRCAAGRQAKHGDDRQWEWAVFFTPAGAESISRDFVQLAGKWLDEGMPKHMVERT